MAEFTIQHVERIATLETKVGTLEERTDKLNSINDAVIRLTSIMEHMVADSEKKDKQRAEDSAKRDAVAKQQNDILAELTYTVKNLSLEFKDTKEDIQDTKDDVTCLKKQVNENEEKSKIDIREILRTWLPKVLFPTAIIISVGYLILQGLKIIP